MKLRVDLDECELNVLTGFIGYLENNHILHSLDPSQRYMIIDVSVKDYSMSSFKEWVPKLGSYITIESDDNTGMYIPIVIDPTTFDLILDWTLEMRNGVTYVWNGNTELGEITSAKFRGFGLVLVETNNTIPWRIKTMISRGYMTNEQVFSIIDEFEKPF